VIRGMRAQPGVIDPASVFVVSAWLAQQLRCPRRDLRLTVDRQREPSGIESWLFHLDRGPTGGVVTITPTRGGSVRYVTAVWNLDGLATAVIGSDGPVAW
jgi:hypothetical protein